MNKNFQDFGTIYESAARCIQAGIRPSFNIIFAFPGEGAKERKETINFIMDVCRKFPGAEFWTNIFTPYPGAPIMDKIAELGVVDAGTHLKVGQTSFRGTPSFLGSTAKITSNFRSCEITYESRSTEFPSVRTDALALPRLAQKCISFPARLRLDHGAYRFPVELWLNDKLKERTAGFKPVVDAKRLEPNEIPVEAAC